MNTAKEFRERYRFDPQKDLLGEGGFAKVFKARDTKLNREVALKIYSAHSTGQRPGLIEEIRNAIQLDHPNILRYFDIVELERESPSGISGKEEILILEYAPEGDLAVFLKRNPGQIAREKIIGDMLRGIEYLHENNIVHFDLKPQNIFITGKKGDWVAKIADFGLSQTINRETQYLTSVVGTINYISPERLQPEKYGARFARASVQADIWAIGILIYEIFTGKPTFSVSAGNNYDSRVGQKIVDSSLPPEVDLVPEPYRTVIKKCLIKNPRSRARSVSQLLGIIRENNTKSDLHQIPEIQSRPKKESPETTFADPPEFKAQAEPLKSAPSRIQAPQNQQTPGRPCPNCGTSNLKNAARCNNCNFVLKGPSFLNSFKPRSPLMPSIWLIAFSAFLVVPSLDDINSCSSSGMCSFDLSPPKHTEIIENGEILLFCGFFMVLWMILAFSFSRFINRSHRNLDALQAKGLNFAHSIGGFIFTLPLIAPLISMIIYAATENFWIPMAIMLSTLILPYFYMKELWKASNPKLIGAKGLAWKGGPNSIHLSLWWISGLLFPISFFIPLIAAKMGPNKTELLINVWWLIVSNGIILMATLLTIALMIRIFFRQKKRFRNLRQTAFSS